MNMIEFKKTLEDATEEQRLQCDIHLSMMIASLPKTKYGELDPVSQKLLETVLSNIHYIRQQYAQLCNYTPVATSKLTDIYKGDAS